MKTISMKLSSIVVLTGVLLFLGCNGDLKQKNKDLSYEDSTLNVKTHAQDSAIMAYVKSFNDIQDNLDSIKVKAKILTISNGENVNQKDQIIADMRSIGDLMMKNKKEIAALERKLKKSNGNNAELQKMISHLTEEVNQKDAEIAALQSQLAETNASLKDVIQRLNDSMKVIGNQKEQITDMNTEINTVYYAIGTSKELKKQGVIKKEGSIAGIGGAEELKKDFNTSYFTKADKTTMQALPLYSKFMQLVTVHPSGSYKITGNGKSDSLVISDAKAFWSQSKYLVVIVKQH
jgi:CII-binding regulator of phage lambda lysogenization HflD